MLFFNISIYRYLYKKKIMLTFLLLGFINPSNEIISYF